MRLRFLSGNLCVLITGAGCDGDKVTRPSPASDVGVEAETMSHSHDRGATPVQIVSRNTASGGQAVEGLDRLQEWIEIPVPFDQTGFYNVVFRHASTEGVQVTVTVAGGGSKNQDPEWLLSLNSGGCG